MQDRIKEHGWDIQLAYTQTSAISEHAQNTGHKLLWNEVDVVNCDSPNWYTGRVKETVHIGLQPNNSNWDSAIEITHDQKKQQLESRTTTNRRGNNALT